MSSFQNTCQDTKVLRASCVMVSLKWPLSPMLVLCWSSLCWSSLTSWSSFDFFCRPCGPWPSHASARGFRQRIVGGRKVNSPRPWMAYIAIRSGQLDFHCGGSIINRLYVLTAGHCVCDQLPCGLQNGHLKASYDPRDKISVIVGLRDVSEVGKEVTTVEKNGTKGSSLNVYQVMRVIVHEAYREDFNDLALLKVSRPFVFTHLIKPICLPFGNRFPDQGQGYVAGWGHEQNVKCHTDAFGPSPFSQCIFPFVYRGEEFTSCTTSTPTPTLSNALCAQLANSSEYGGLLRHQKARVVVKSELDNSITTCYALEAKKRGWCATCKPKGNVTDPNFCSPNQPRQTLVAAVVRHDDLWGICKANCLSNGGVQTEDKENVLREVKLSILKSQQCHRLLNVTGSRYEPNLELCAGHVNRVHNTHLMLRRSGHFEAYETEVESERSQVFIGGRDSCLGDSGGPLWILLGSKNRVRAFLVGLVSRGVNCANNDAPGIYVRVKKYLKWIKTHANEGQC